MTRARYEPPRWGGTPSSDAVSFERVVPGEPIPWMLSAAAANSMPAPLPEGELALLREAACEHGLAEGRAAAELELAAAHAQLQLQLEAGLAELVDWRRNALEGYRHELAELALAIAEAVLQRELSTGMAAIESLLEQAMAAIDPEERCTIHVAPALASATIAWASTHWPSAAVRSDAELAVGELRVRAKSGTLDADLRARIDTVRRLVLGDAERAP
jgi:flagellar biosynthesis/type III secretory pathway protein FliH